MKVSEILKRATACSTEADAKALLNILEVEVCRSRILFKLGTANAESSMEDGKPFVQFELNNVISPEYITTIKPEIRDGLFVIHVTTNRMLTKLGLSSQNWEAVKGLDALPTVVPKREHTILSAARSAGKLAIEHHAVLLQTLGLSTVVARKAARGAW